MFGMILAAFASPRFSAIQNSLAAALFLLFLAAQGAAYLLYLYPGAELLWMLSIPLNRICSPFLYAFDIWTGFGAFQSMAVLAAAAVIPIAAQWSRNWLGTACAGHIAFAVCALLMEGAMQRAGSNQASAGLPVIYPAGGFDSSSVVLALVTAAFAVLCLINHVVFFSNRVFKARIGAAA